MWGACCWWVLYHFCDELIVSCRIFESGCFLKQWVYVLVLKLQGNILRICRDSRWEVCYKRRSLALVSEFQHEVRSLGSSWSMEPVVLSKTCRVWSLQFEARRPFTHSANQFFIPKTDTLSYLEIDLKDCQRVVGPLRGSLFWDVISVLRTRRETGGRQKIAGSPKSLICRVLLIKIMTRINFSMKVFDSALLWFNELRQKEANSTTSLI